MASRGTPIADDGIERPKWLVVGTRIDNGEPVEIVVLSRSEERARDIASGKRISVARVTRLTPEPAPVAPPPEPPASTRPAEPAIVEVAVTAPEPVAAQRRQATCLLCHSTWLQKRQVWRMSQPVRIIGVIVLVPCMLGMALAIVSALFTVLQNEPESDGWDGLVLARLVWCGAFFVASFVSGLLGWLLIMKRTVLACVECGAAYDAV